MCARACVRVHVCAILTRSRARAGVSVRLFFACTLRVRGVTSLRFGRYASGFFVTSLRFGRYASGACVCVHTCGVREFHAPGGCICDRAARACACECTRRVRDFFSKRTLRFAPRLVKPPEGWVILVGH